MVQISPLMSWTKLESLVKSELVPERKIIPYQGLKVEVRMCTDE